MSADLHSYASFIRGAEAALPFEDRRRRPIGNRLYIGLFKRVLDITIVLLSLPLTLPVILIAAALVSLDRGSCFYRQHRVGLGGERFAMLKLRTMVPNAKERLADYLDKNPEAKAEWDATQKLKNDPRITPVGRILRKYSIDELPQIWNVLHGDMSIVGPRPIMTDQVELYTQKEYYALRPGLTGLWQVSGRNETTFAERIAFDVRYCRDLSFWNDIRLIFKTFGAVLGKTGC